MLTYDMSDKWHVTWDAADRLDAAAKWQQDCLSVLCTLSRVGAWEISEDGQMCYRVPCEDREGGQTTQTGIQLVEVYSPGDSMIPTGVAQHFGLGEVNICANAGHILQGDNILEAQVHQVVNDAHSSQRFAPTTLHEILKQDGEVDNYWKPLEWRHIQSVVDSDGGQESRFRLLSEILRRLAGAYMDESTFIPYGHQFADSDFVDSI